MRSTMEALPVTSPAWAWERWDKTRMQSKLATCIKFLSRAANSKARGGSAAGLGAFSYFPLLTYIQLALGPLLLSLNPKQFPRLTM